MQVGSQKFRYEVAASLLVFSDDDIEGSHMSSRGEMKISLRLMTLWLLTSILSIF
jgi:hypothetical protein